MMSSSKHLTDTLISMIKAVVENTGIREQEIIAIRMHPDLYFQLNRELANTTIPDIDVKRARFMNIPIIMDMDVWIAFENRPRIGWP